MMKRLPISVCLIVKNEEAYLDACLKSVKDWVNEIIVVDTGSTDRTVEIAKENGAKVSYFEWIGDFAAARNESISKASNPWILQLDADEEMIESNISWFGETYPWIDNDGYYLLLNNLRDVSSKEVVMSHRLVRFYRNHPDIRYKFKIHENIIIPSRKLSQSQAQILHKGYGKEIVNEEKSKRNLEILLEVINENPKDPFNHHYVSQCYLAMGLPDEALKACMKSLKYGVTYPVRTHVYRTVFNGLSDNGDVRTFAEVEKTIADEALFPEIDFYRGKILVRMKEKTAARHYFLKFIESYKNPPEGKLLGDESFILIPNVVSAYTILAGYETERGNYNSALDYLRSAQIISPMSSFLYPMMAKMMVILGKKTEAVSMLKEAIEVFQKQQTKLSQKSLITGYEEVIRKIEQSQ